MRNTSKSDTPERYLPLREYCVRQRLVFDRNRSQAASLRQALYRRIDWRRAQAAVSVGTPAPVKQHPGRVAYAGWQIFIRPVSRGYMYSMITPQGRLFNELSLLFPSAEAAGQFACRYIDWLSKQAPDSGSPPPG